MDEPTNHLDLFSKEVLLDALRLFDGTVIFVSHDRYFVNALATRIVEVENGGLEIFYGNYEYYLEKKSVQTAGVTAVATHSPSPAALPPAKDVRLLDREEQKRQKREDEKRRKQLTEIEKEISATETAIEKLEQEMESEGFFNDPERGREAGERHAGMNLRLEDLYREWENLSG